MPCRDYESDWFTSNSWGASEAARRLKKQADKLATIACKAMYALENLDPELKTLKDPEVNKWWSNYRKLDQERILEDEKKKVKDAKKIALRKEVMKKLTREEIKAFGLDKKGV